MEWEEYEAKQAEMFSLVDKYIKNVQSISEEDKRGKYHHALQKLWERCFKLVRWYIIEQSAVKNLYIEANQAGGDYVREVAANVFITSKMEESICDFMTDGDKIKLENIVTETCKEVCDRWFVYIMSTDRCIHTPLNAETFWNQVSCRKVPAAKM